MTALATWMIVAASLAGVIGRPWRLPEAWWAMGGALILLVAGLVTPREAIAAIGRAADVGLFLAGMMTLAAIARHEGLFDWLAAHAVRRARGSARSLFAWLYAAGIVVTAFLSNDATAVVLTQAVLAATRAARAEPLPHLFACALIANAASFVLPISNPANLVLYGGHMPSLLTWVGHFALASAGSISATYVALRLVFRASLQGEIAGDIEVPPLPPGAVIASIGLAGTAVALLAASAFGAELGWPTAVCGAATLALVTIGQRASPVPVLGGISWGVLPLVAGLFVMVEGMSRTGATAALAQALRHASGALAGAALAVACNLTNNLPASLLTGTAARSGQVPAHVVDSLLVGVDIGPNLSVTGSLATILWLGCLRREGLDVTFGQFLLVGLVAMPAALALALLGLAA